MILRKLFPKTSAFFLGLGYDTVTLDFWVPLEKAQVFEFSIKNSTLKLEAWLIFVLIKMHISQLTSRRGYVWVIYFRFWYSFSLVIRKFHGVLCLFYLTTCVRVCHSSYGPLRECLWARRFRASLLLHLHMWSFRLYLDVDSNPKKKYYKQTGEVVVRINQNVEDTHHQLEVKPTSTLP